MFLPTAIICTVLGFTMLLSIEMAIAKALGFLWYIKIVQNVTVSAIVENLAFGVDV